MMANEDFDWSLVLSNDEYSPEQKKDFEDQYKSTLPDVISKQLIDGKVVMISDREVVVDINFKSDGVISFNEFKYNQDLKIGDVVEVLVEKQEDKNGQLILSHRRARVLSNICSKFTIKRSENLLLKILPKRTNCYLFLKLAPL